MKIIFAFVLFFLSCPIVFGQTEAPQTSAQNGVAAITLARGSGGEAGEATTSFTTADVPIYCLIELASTKIVSVKMNVVAVAAIGLRAVVSVVYKTDGRQTGVTFTASPEKTWAAGKYRVDVSLDGKPAKSLEFEIQKTSAQVEKERSAAPKPKPKSKPKKSKSRK